MPLNQNGIVIAKPLADILNISPADSLTVEVREGRQPTLTIPVLGIAETLLGAPTYMDMAWLNRHLGEPHRVSGAYPSLDGHANDAVYQSIKNMPAVVGMTLKRDSQAAFAKLMDTGAGAMRYIMALIAGVITFGIIYNAARISYAERERDLASLRVIGFTRGETAFVLLGELGGTAATQVLSQLQRTTQVKTALLTMHKQLAFARHQLAVLSGQNPSQLETGELTLADLTLPKELPLSLPSQLVKQRPDIQLAERMIKARHDELGIAIANQLPQLTLSGSYGTLSTEGSDLFDPVSVVWNIGAGLAQPLFRGGELRHSKRVAVAQLEESTALYRQTVLAAFQQVADSVRALEFDATAHSGAIDAERNSAVVLKKVEQEKVLGSASVLDVKRQYHDMKANRIRAHATQSSDTVALFHALGGSWIRENTSSEKPE